VLGKSRCGLAKTLGPGKKKFLCKLANHALWRDPFGKTVENPIRLITEALPLNRSLVTRKHIRPPKALEALFDNRPLVGRERPEEYDAFFSAIARAEIPSDAIDWILLKDLVDLAWEIQRERRLKMEIIKINQTEVICDLLKSIFDKADRLGSAVNRVFNARTEAHLWASDAETRKSIDLKLTEKGHNPDSVLARAYVRGAREIDAIDKRIALHELRRNAILKEIALRGERKAQKLAKASSDVIEGEFTEAAE
jgi:hypothetical protein